jgi:hypothetical protein
MCHLTTQMLPNLSELDVAKTQLQSLAWIVACTAIATLPRMFGIFSSEDVLLARNLRLQDSAYLDIMANVIRPLAMESPGGMFVEDTDLEVLMPTCSIPVGQLYPME